MFTKKLDKTDLEELRKREELINQHVLITQALQSQKQSFILNRFSRYGLDITKEYSIDLKTGKITESKQRSLMNK
jgi:hypothetical protein